MAASQHSSHAVTCHGVHAELSINELSGDICYLPVGGNKQGASCCGGAQHVQRQYDGRYVVGAALVSPNSFRVWHCVEVKGAGAPAFKLRKSAAYECSSGQEAVQLVERIRCAACWWGTPTPPRLVAIVNPKSGQGKALKQFQRHVLPVLEEACGMTVVVHLTGAHGHATELMHNLDLASTDMVLSVGGDGTLYEGLQGLLTRPDWEEAAALPLAHIPGGSGNGVAHSCGLKDFTTAAFSICKGHTSPMDVASVLQAPSRRMYILLSMVYGLLANVDVDTEHLRWMGDVRFTLGSIKEMLRLKPYAMRVAWLPDTSEGAPSSSKRTATAAGNTAASSRPLPSSSIRETLLTSRTTSGSLVDAAVTPEGQAGSKATGNSIFSITDFPPGPPLQLLQQLEGLPTCVPEPHALPSGWRILQEPLLLWSVTNPPFVAEKYRLNPVGRLQSGHMNMMWIAGLKGRRGRLSALDTMLKAEAGDHMDAPHVEHDSLKALVFEPRDTATYLQLDGEVVDSRTVYMEVHPGLIQVVINPFHPNEKASTAPAASPGNMV